MRFYLIITLNATPDSSVNPTRPEFLGRRSCTESDCLNTLPGARLISNNTDYSAIAIGNSNNTREILGKITPNWISESIGHAGTARKLTRHPNMSHVALNVCIVCEACESEDFNETEDRAAAFDPYSIFTFVSYKYLRRTRAQFDTCRCNPIAIIIALVVLLSTVTRRWHERVTLDTCDTCVWRLTLCVKKRAVYAGRKRSRCVISILRTQNLRLVFCPDVTSTTKKEKRKKK